MKTPEQIAEFLADPANFLIGLDLAEGQFQFINMPRQEVSEKAFMDTRAIEPRHEKTALHGGAVMQALEGQSSAKADYLFHTSFCCSTVIARCMDVPGKALSLKEPYPLLGLSGFKRRNKNFDAVGDLWQNWQNLTLRLLSRPFLEGETVLIKPSNGANNILPEVLSCSGTGKAVLLYSTLDYFLAAVISGGEDRFQYASGILPLFIKDFGAGLNLSDPASMTKMQRAALVWALQMKGFQEAAAATPDKTRTLNAQRFLDDPLKVLNLLDEFYGLGIGPTALEKISTGPVMSQHSKQPDKSYSPADQGLETRNVIQENKKELAEVAAWCQGLGLDFEAGLTKSL